MFSARASHIWLSFLACILAVSSFAQNNAPAPDPKVAAISGRLRQLRSLPDDERASVTRQLALEIRQLPVDLSKLKLALNLSGLATEGDFGEKTLQEVATTLAQSLHEQPQPERDGSPALPYIELATLVRYEHVNVSLDDPQFTAAMAQMEDEDRQRQQADFTLTDLTGKTWTLKELKGKVVIVNFWATWCPPCRKEMPDLQALWQKYEKKGLVILAISDESRERVDLFFKRQKVTYPVLLDAGGSLQKGFAVRGIPESFVYDREGKLAAVAIDMRTRKQFLRMLESAGLTD